MYHDTCRAAEHGKTGKKKGMLFVNSLFDLEQNQVTSKPHEPGQKLVRFGHQPEVFKDTTLKGGLMSRSSAVDAKSRSG